MSTQFYFFNIIKRVGLIITASLIASACSPVGTATPATATPAPATSVTTAPTTAPTTAVANAEATTAPATAPTTAATTASTESPSTIFHNIVTLGISLSYPTG